MTYSASMGYWDALAPGLVIALIAIACLPWFDRTSTLARTVAIGFCLLLAWRYMLWRIAYTIPPTDVPIDFTFGVAFTLLEALSMIGTTSALLFLTRIRNRSREADANLRWLSRLKRLPKVDVLICTYNEDETILERTIIGSLAMTYPNYRVWVCDDGRRVWLRDLCARFGVGYLTRPDNLHAKAGNINAALKVLSSLEDKPDFISILDADFVPLPSFLERSLALMRDDGVGVVQTPQHFFNPDPVQSNLSIARVWPDEQRFFFDVVMATKDAWGAAFCCGTSSLIRFAPLLRIGGFPTDSVTEDYLVSLRLRQIGYRTVYLNERLSLGLAPEGLAEYAVQRSRWCLGFVQICRGPSGPLNPANGLPFVDRLMLVETFLYWAASHAFRLFAAVIPALYLLCDIQAVHANVIDAIDHIFPFFVAQAAIIIWISGGRVLPVIADLYQVLCAADILKAVTSGLLHPKHQKFKVTAKGGDRSRRFVQWPMLRVFLILLVLNVLGILNAFVFYPTQPLAESSAVALWWSWYNILVLVLASYVSIEQQQRRVADRFRTDESVRIDVDGRRCIYTSQDISATGMRLSGPPPAPVGTRLRIALDPLELSATVARLTNDGFALRFELSPVDRINLIRRIYSGRYSATIDNIAPARVAGAIAARLFR